MGEETELKKSQPGEEGRRDLSELLEENPPEEDPVPDRQFCIHSVSPLTKAGKLTFWTFSAVPRPAPQRGIVSRPAHFSLKKHHNSS